MLRTTPKPNALPDGKLMIFLIMVLMIVIVTFVWALLH